MIKRNIKWLISDEDSPIQMGPSSDQVRKKIPYPEGLAEGYTEQTLLLENITVIQEKHHFISEDRPSNFLLGTFEVDLNEQSLVISILHSGSMQIYSYEHDVLRQRKPNEILFVRAKKYKIKLSIDTEEDAELTVLIIPDATLEKLLGTIGVDTFFTNLELQNKESFALRTFPAAVSEPIRNCMLEIYEEKLRNLFAQTKILQYLIDINLNVIANKKSTPRAKSKSFNIEDVHAALLDLTTEVPTLSSLGERFDTSPSTLNAEFLKKYQQSIYSFITNQRMEQAYYAITHSDVPMKLLAHRIGYSHVNHFITAFKKKFGVTPGSLRKKG
jgi:AraC-like DNA-binding protein